MGVWELWNSKGQIIAKTSCGKGKGNVLGVRKRTSEKRESKKLSSTEGVFLPVSPSSLVGEADLFGLIQNDREEADGEGDHESDPASVKKRKRSQEPDDGVLKFAGAGYRGKEDGITEDEGQSPAGKTSQAEPVPGDGQPRKERHALSRSEKSLKKKKSKKKNRPDPKVTKKLPDRQF